MCPLRVILILLSAIVALVAIFYSLFKEEQEAKKARGEAVEVFACSLNFLVLTRFYRSHARSVAFFWISQRGVICTISISRCNQADVLSCADCVFFAELEEKFCLLLNR